MDIISLVLILLTIASLFIWNRTEGRADIRHMDARLESNRNLIVEIHNETSRHLEAIREEMKDFHYKLLDIERRRNDKPEKKRNDKD